MYSAKNRLVGEVDLVGVHANGIDIFEIKCSYRVVKAKQQLEKIRKLFGADNDASVGYYFYCGAASQLEKIE
jgi:hypothetical protein